MTTYVAGPRGPRPTNVMARASLDPWDALAFLWCGALIVASWPLLANVGRPRLPVLGLTAHVTGTLAGYGVVLMVLSMARLPAAERGVGADVLARWHARGGRTILGLVVVHAWAATAAWAGAHEESFPLAAWQVLGMPGLPAATLATLLMVAVAVVSVRAARRHLKHESWHGLHLSMYLAVALALPHQLAGPDFAGHRWLQVGWALAYAHVFAVVLRHRLLAPLRQATRHRLRVTAVHEEGPGVVSIVVQGQHLDELEAESGQFFRWRFLTPDHWLNAHPFSLSAPPTADRLRLTVKALGDGSRGLQRLPVGTWVIAEGPYGAVTSHRRTRKDVLLIAGGVGITPMRALFETLPMPDGGDLLLVYRAQSEEEVLFRAELDAVARARAARVLYVLGTDHQALSTAHLVRFVPNLAQRDVFLCGPPGLTAAVRRSLSTAGLPTEQLHEERFAF